MGGLLRRAVASGRHRTIRDVIAENLGDIAELRSNGWPWGKIAKLLEEDAPMVGDIAGATVSRYCRMLGLAEGGSFPANVATPPVARKDPRPAVNGDSQPSAVAPQAVEAGLDEPKRRRPRTERKPAARGFDFSAYKGERKQAGDDILAAAGIVAGEEISVIRTIGPSPRQEATTSAEEAVQEVATEAVRQDPSEEPEAEAQVAGDAATEAAEEVAEVVEAVEESDVAEAGHPFDDEAPMGEASGYDDLMAMDGMSFEPPPDFGDDIPDGLMPPEVDDDFAPPEDDRF